MNGVERIATERERQEERWSLAHDDEHDTGELQWAAYCYLVEALTTEFADSAGVGAPLLPKEWPWASSTWRPALEASRNLEKAGALIAAEIDRLQRRGDE